MKSGQGIDEYVKRNELEGLYNSQKKAFDDKFSDINMVLEKMREVISIRFGEDFGNNKYDKELESLKGKIYSLQEEIKRNNPMDEDFLNDKFQNIEQNIVKSRKIIEEYTLQFKEDIIKIETEGRDRTLLAKQEKRIKAFKDDLSKMDKELRNYIDSTKDLMDKSNDALSQNLCEKVSETENLIKQIEDKLETKIDGVRFQINDLNKSSKDATDEMKNLIDLHKQSNESLVSEIEKQTKENIDSFKVEVNEAILGIQKDVEANKENNENLIAEAEKQTKENIDRFKVEVNEAIVGIQKDVEANKENNENLIAEAEKQLKENIDGFKVEVNEAIVGMHKDIDASKESSATLVVDIEKQLRENVDGFKVEIKENIEGLKKENNDLIYSAKNEMNDNITDIKNIIQENDIKLDSKIKELWDKIINENKVYKSEIDMLFDNLHAETEERFNKMSDIIVYNKQTTNQEVNKLEERINLNFNAKINELNYDGTLDKIETLDKKIDEKYENDYKEIQKLCNTIKLLEDRIDYENEERKIGINKIREDIGSNDYYITQIIEKQKELESTNNEIIKQIQGLGKHNKITKQKNQNNEIQMLENSMKEIMDKQLKIMEEKYEEKLKQLESIYNKKLNDIEKKYQNAFKDTEKTAENENISKKATKIKNKKSTEKKIEFKEKYNVIPFEENKNDFLGMYPKVSQRELKESASDINNVNISKMIAKLENPIKSTKTVTESSKKSKKISNSESINAIISDKNNLDIEINKPVKRNQILGNFD